MAEARGITSFFWQRTIRTLESTNWEIGELFSSPSEKADDAVEVDGRRGREMTRDLRGQGANVRARQVKRGLVRWRRVELVQRLERESSRVRNRTIASKFAVELLSFFQRAGETCGSSRCLIWSKLTWWSNSSLPQTATGSCAGLETRVFPAWQKDNSTRLLILIFSANN